LKIRLIVLFLLLVIVISCKQPDVENPSPEYVGTWKGINIEILPGVFCDVELILTESNYTINLYEANGGIVLLFNSAMGTHAEELPADTVITLNQTHVYDGVTWNVNPAIRYTEYSITNNIMDFKYDYNHPHDAWDIVDQLIKQ